MKKELTLVMASVIVLSSCATVDSGHKGVRVSWGGETDMTQVYTEGLHTGVMYLIDNMVEYDVREKTTVQRFEFNDKNNMSTVVELSLDYSLNPDKVNFLHTKITDVDVKILKTLKSAGKEVVPQYSAIELNISKRTEAEAKLAQIIADELPEFYIEFKRLQMTDVDIPEAVANLAEETAVQLGRNELAKKKEAEQTALAKAAVARSKGLFEAAEYDVKTKKLMSQPAVLKLYQAETDRQWAIQGKSKYGNNNVFGAGVSVLKGLNQPK
jgi:hypothetical protein|tara:strand:+ start:289 stop:1095 length:807 start_codon:yes stop_codon:yes gene_type:complete